MADSLTVTYDFVLPEVGASDDTWGSKLNGDFTQLDALLTGAFAGGDAGDLGRLKPSHAPQNYDTLILSPAGVHIRMKQSDVNDNGYGTIFSSDATNFYMQLTANNDAGGAANALRPFQLRKSDGLLTMSTQIIFRLTPDVRSDDTAGFRIMDSAGATERMYLFSDTITDTVVLRNGSRALHLEADGDLRVVSGQFAGSGAGLTGIPISALPTDSSAESWVRGRMINFTAASAVGSYSLLYYTTPGVDNFGNQIRPGSAFQVSNVEGGASSGGSSPGGSWLCTSSSPSNTQASRTALWFRIS